MAYVGSERPAAGGASGTGAGSRPSTTVGSIGTRPPGAAERAIPGDGFDWDRFAVLATGIAVGALLATGITLLAAPQSGMETRRALQRRARRAVWGGQDAWEDLRDELAVRTARKKKELRRRRRARSL